MINSSQNAQTQEGNFPNGAAMAALLAAGIGCFAFGLFIVLAEVSELVKQSMTLC